MTKQNNNKGENTYLEKLCEIFVNSLIILSFIKILVFQLNFVNISILIILLLIFIFLLLFKNLDTLLRTVVSSYSLYLFYFKELNNIKLSTSIFSLLIIYSVLYALFRVIIFKKKLELEIISNWLALSLSIKLFYSYYYSITKFFDLNQIFYFFIIIIFLLIIPILEDIIRSFLSFLASLDILMFLNKYLQSINLIIIIFIILVYFLIQYKTRIKKIYN